MATATSSLASSASLGGVGDVPLESGAGSSGNGDAELGSLLSSAYDEASGGDVPAGEAGTPESIPYEAPIETPPGEAPTSPEAQAQPAQPQAGESPYPLSPDGKAFMVPREALPALQSAQKFAETVQQWFGTPQEAQGAYLQASDLRTMQNDWVYGQPEAIKSVMAHWAGMNHQDPAIRARFQNSFSQMAQLMPSFLKTTNPQAYQALIGGPARFDANGAEISPASGLLLSAVEAAYEKAAQTGNPEDLKQAQYLDYGATGKYKTELPRPDPNQQRMTEFERRSTEFEQRQSAALNRDVLAFNNNALEGAKFNDFRGAIDKVLAPVKARYSDVAYEDLKNGIQREVIDTMKANAEWWLEHEQTYHQLVEDYKHTWRGGNPGNGLESRIAAYKADFQRQAQRLLPSIAQKRIGAATQRSRANNGQFAAPGQRAPQSPAAQAPQGQNGTGDRRLSSDEWDAALKDAMTVR